MRVIAAPWRFDGPLDAECYGARESARTAVASVLLWDEGPEVQ